MAARFLQSPAVAGRRKLTAGLLLAGCGLAGLLIGLPAAHSAPRRSGGAGGGGAVTIYWSCAGVADVYLNGRPLREAPGDFSVRGDESGHEYSAQAPLRVGDVITVGAKRGSRLGGFRLVALDDKGRAVWQTDTSNWKAFPVRDAGSAHRFFMPQVYGRPTTPATAPTKDMPASEDLGKPKTAKVGHIWYQEGPYAFLYCQVTPRRNLVRLPLWEMGRSGKLQYILDGAEMTGLNPDDLDDSNRVKGGSSPLRFDYLFRQPQEVHGVLVSFGSPNKGTFTWQVGYADSRADLEGKKGSYHEVVASQTMGPNEAVDVLFKPVKAACWRLTAKADGPRVGVRKFDLLTPPTKE